MTGKVRIEEVVADKTWELSAMIKQMAIAEFEPEERVIAYAVRVEKQHENGIFHGSAHVGHNVVRMDESDLPTELEKRGVDLCHTCASHAVTICHSDDKNFDFHAYVFAEKTNEILGIWYQLGDFYVTLSLGTFYQKKEMKDFINSQKKVVALLKSLLLRIKAVTMSRRNVEEIAMRAREVFTQKNLSTVLGKVMVFPATNELISRSFEMQMKIYAKVDFRLILPKNIGESVPQDYLKEVNDWFSLAMIETGMEGNSSLTELHPSVKHWGFLECLKEDSVFALVSLVTLANGGVSTDVLRGTLMEIRRQYFENN